MQNKYKKQLSIFETRRGKMRIRFKPWARPELEECSYFIDSPKEMKNKWKDEYEKYYNKISNAVKNTKDLVMKKDGNLFKSYS